MSSESVSYVRELPSFCARSRISVLDTSIRKSGIDWKKSSGKQSRNGRAVSSNERYSLSGP